MKRHELSVKVDYLPGWDLYAGIRELMQNARDAEIQDGARMIAQHVFRVRNKQPIGAVVIINEGTTIPKEAFLIGHTSKFGRNDLAGRYGEGFKFGVLALLRLGLDIKIRNGQESWNPLIVPSKDYDAKVLAFDVADGNKFENRVQIEILGVSLEDWEQIKEKFLFIVPSDKEKTIFCPSGEILLEEKYRGKIFVKGIYVCSDSKLTFGYNIKEADLDRDRKMLSAKSYVTSKLLMEAVSEGKLTEKVYELLRDGAEEGSSITGSYLSLAAKEKIVKAFKNQYGENALPVDYDSQAVELGHLGIRGVNIPYALRSILCESLDSPVNNINKLRMNAKNIYELNELTEVERNNFQKSLKILLLAIEKLGYDKTTIPSLTVVDFADPNLSGTFLVTDKSVRIARKVLINMGMTLRVLIHEIAHIEGGDGTKQHEESQGNLFAKVFEVIMDKNNDI